MLFGFLQAISLHHVCFVVFFCSLLRMILVPFVIIKMRLGHHAMIVSAGRKSWCTWMIDSGASVGISCIFMVCRWHSLCKLQSSMFFSSLGHLSMRTDTAPKNPLSILIASPCTMSHPSSKTHVHLEIQRTSCSETEIDIASEKTSKWCIICIHYRWMVHNSSMHLPYGAWVLWTLILRVMIMINLYWNKPHSIVMKTCGITWDNAKGRKAWDFIWENIKRVLYLENWALGADC